MLMIMIVTEIYCHLLHYIDCGIHTCSRQSLRTNSYTNLNITVSLFVG